MEHDFDKAANLKLFLSFFEQLSELKINFHKSELFCFGEAQDAVDQYAELFGCAQGLFLLSIWAYRYIIGDCLMRNGSTWKNVCKKD